jgi:hypothetical protein
VRFTADGVVETIKRLPGLVLLDLSFFPAFSESHLLSIVEVYENKPWPVTLSCAATHINYENFYEALLCKSPVRSEVRVKRLTHIFCNILYKNLTIRIYNINCKD